MREAGVWSRYRTYLETPPEEVVQWSDPGTGARGWLVINSLRGGAAGGGTRMRCGVSLEELVYLAKTMELKFAFAGPPVGGAKSGIDFDPGDPRKSEVLRDWFAGIHSYLRECYATGGDYGVDEVREVIPGCRAVGIRHPQEGVVRGHLRANGGDLDRILTVLERGVTASLDGDLAVPGLALTVSDVVAGYGLAAAVRRFYERRGEELNGARAVVEGFGAVGAGAALALARVGARIVAIADAEKTLIEPAGLGADEVADLLARRPDRRLPEDPRCVPGADRAPDVEAEIFVAAALSDSIDANKLARLEAASVRVIVSGANHPFREARLGATELQRAADRRFAVIPDVIGSAGTACGYSYLMSEGAAPEPAAILADVDSRIARTLDEVMDRTGDAGTGLLEATLAAALDRIDQPG